MIERIAAFCVGMVVGASIIVAVKGHDLEHLYLELRTLRQDNSQLQEEVTGLENDLKQKQKMFIRRIRKIEVHADAEDEFKKLTITRSVNELCKPLIDKELSYLDEHPQLITGLINDHTIKLDDVRFMTLQVTSVVIGETLRIWVKGVMR